MFDCPMPSHTSPTSTSENVVPQTTSWRPTDEYAIGSSVTRHLPSAPAFAVFVCPANLTTTFSPGSAMPHTGTGRFACNTAPSVNTAAGRTAANAGSATSETKRRRVVFIMVLRLVQLIPE